MNFEEFIRPTEPVVDEAESVLGENASEIDDSGETSLPEELDVQKAVVESLAADKAAQDEEISRLKADNALLRERVEKNVAKIVDLEAQKAQTDFLKSQIAEMKAALEKVGDVLARNTEGEMSSKIALLERNLECDDRFPGETCSRYCARRATKPKPREGSAVRSSLKAFSSRMSRTARLRKSAQSSRSSSLPTQTSFPAW